MKISASIYSGDGKKNFEHLVKELDHHNVDLFHIDCIDDFSVFVDIENIRKISSTPIDLHIITSQPEAYFSLIEKHKIEYVTFQYENLLSNLELPVISDSRFGIAFTSATPVDTFEKYKDRFKFVLMMTTEPGKSGGIFNKENFNKIREFRKLYPNKKIHVDGGINDEISFILRNMGVDTVVSGSYLVNADSISSAMVNLKIKESSSMYCIKDFMISGDEVPKVKPSEMTLENVLNSIEDYKLGFTIITDETDRLKGIISNADVRKTLIRYVNRLNDLNVMEMLNTKPVFINENRNISEMLKLIKKQNFPIFYLPVVNNENKVTGAILFNNLIKGES